MYLYSFFDEQVRAQRDRLGMEIKIDNIKVRVIASVFHVSISIVFFQAKAILGLSFSDINNALIEMVDSMIERGIVPATPTYHK